MQARALRQGLLAALLGTGLFFLALEALLRLLGYVPEDIPYGYDPDLVGDYLPDKRHIARHPPPADHTPYRFDTNGQGLRADQEYALPKPAGVRRVLMLGDSFTFGPFLDNHEIASAQLQELLNEPDDADAIEVVNAAMSGWTLADEFAYLREKGLRLEPDLVVVNFYVNDVREFHPFFRATLGRENYKRQAGSPLFQAQLFLRRYSATYYLLRDIKDHFDVERQLATMPDLEAHDYRPLWSAYLREVDALHAFLAKRQIPLLFVLVPESTGPRQPQWATQNAASPDSLLHRLQTAAREEGNRLLSSNALLPLMRQTLTQRSVGYVDLLDLFARMGPIEAAPQSLYLWPHDHHLSHFGHRVLAQAMADYLHRHPLLTP